MSREIRRVPPDWEHPKEFSYRRGVEDFVPLYDEAYRTHLNEWLEELHKWDSGEDPDRQRVDPEHQKEYWDWHGGPGDPSTYRPYWPPESQTAYQVYESVTEGTPVSPVLLTEEALIDWLCNVGDSMGIGGATYKMTREQALRFIAEQWAVSMVLDEGGLRSGTEAL